MTNLTRIYFLCMFISILYMFRAFKCSSSGDSVVSIQYLVYVTLCRWPSGMQSDKYQISYWHNWIPCWWALECSKHVENWSKRIQKKKNCASSWSLNRTVQYLSYQKLPTFGKKNCCVGLYLKAEFITVCCRPSAGNIVGGGLHHKL